MTNLGKWEETYRTRAPFPYGTDLTYRLGAEFLIDCGTIEDWGCGTQWFRRVMHVVNPAARVIGLDGSAGYCDRVVDLVDYLPERRPDGIFLRHVLEHNHEWRTILEQALRSFTWKMVLVLFTPFAEKETLLFDYVFPDGTSCPYLSLARHELEQRLRRHRFIFSIETMSSPETEYGMESVILISRTSLPREGPNLP